MHKTLIVNRSIGPIVGSNVAESDCVLLVQAYTSQSKVKLKPVSAFNEYYFIRIHRDRMVLTWRGKALGFVY